MRARIVVVVLAVMLVAACAPGTPDLGFSPTVSVPYGSSLAGLGGPTQLVPLADGGVVATRSPARPLTRITGAGEVDAAWGATLPNDCRRTSRAIATGTGVLFTCSRLLPPSGPEVWQVWRVTAAGALDKTFGGGDGIVDVPEVLNEFDIVPLPNGGYLGLGYAASVPNPTSVTPLVAIVYSAAGAMLSSTEIPITVLPLPPGFDGWRIAVRLASTPNGVVALETLSTQAGNGFVVNLWRVQRFDANGAVANTPEFGGPTDGDIVGNDAISGLVALRDGRTAVIGVRTIVNTRFNRASTDSYLWLVGTEGTVPPGGGAPLVLANGGRFDPTAIVATNDERFLVIVGTVPAGPPLTARYAAGTGTLDPTYGDGGRAGLALTRADALAPRAGFDQLYVGGSDSSDRPAVARIWAQVTP